MEMAASAEPAWSCNGGGAAARAMSDGLGIGARGEKMVMIRLDDEAEEEQNLK